MKSQDQTTLVQAIPQVSYQPCGDPRGLTKPNLTEFSGDPLEWTVPKSLKRPEREPINIGERLNTGCQDNSRK